MTNDTKIPTDNRDPITGAPGAHPVGTGVGAAVGGMAAGAAAVTLAAGPIGTVAGAAVGALVGGLAGKGDAEHFDPTREDAYWRDNYARESYYDKSFTYDDYSPAYRLGYVSRGKYQGRQFSEVERDLEAEYGRAKGQSKLGWDRAKHATRAAWDRVERSVSGGKSTR